MGKTMCETGNKERKKRLEKPAAYECRKCGIRVKKKDWVCKPVQL
jgi:lipopolysaccharide biosynthesis regulator YciM